jgi:hypothetical protein
VTDKAWDAIHRCLGDGTLSSDGSSLSRCVLGGRQLYEGDEYIVSYVTREEAKEVADAVVALDRDWLFSRYAALAATDYDGPHDDDDREYTWDNFQALRDFMVKAAGAGRAVIFTVDQ